MWFKILWAADGLAVLAVLYFFLEGVRDGTVSSYNIFLWTAILAGLFAVMYGSLWLKKKNQKILSLLLLLVLAIPTFLYVLFILYALSSGMRWN
jgi:ABC-type dipeptide/oligopeptide/nickel transport system permease component